MPSMNSPPMRPVRSPMKRSSGSEVVNLPPVPPLPIDTMFTLTSPPPPSPMSRSSSSSSGSSRVSTPPLSRRRSSSRLLPALPLALTPKMKRVAVDYSGMEGVKTYEGESMDHANPRGQMGEMDFASPRGMAEDVDVDNHKRTGGMRVASLRGTAGGMGSASRRRMTGVMDVADSGGMAGERDLPSPRRMMGGIDFAKTQATTPTMRQDPSGLDFTSPRKSELDFASPRTTQSVFESDTPRVRDSFQTDRLETDLARLGLEDVYGGMDSNTYLGENDHKDIPTPSRPPRRYAITPDPTTRPLPTSLPMGRKRDSAQRRLSALRGLVGNLDFNQPWSVAEVPEEPVDFVWACEEPAVVVSDHGWKEDLPELTPRRSSLPRKPNTTPPRRKSLRSELRTPEPRPRQRTEIFQVASGGYSKSIEPVSPLPTTPTSTWRSSLSNDEVYHRASSIEVKRQEIIWEMCETEHAFVKSMRTVLRLFAIPLKTPQGKWIDGIPSRITELFDSLERVAHAHGVISAGQRDMRRRNEVVDVGVFVAMFRGWVHRLEVHELYLLKFEAVVQLVEENVRDQDSVFGEFVRMQMKEEVLGSMSLGSMLLKPVQRLTKYPLFLKRLLDVTPHPHPTHTDILALLSTTESIILTLQATKAREDDLEQLRLLESRLQGLPPGFTLAVRGRKLIGHGHVVKVQNNLPRRQSSHSSRGSISSSDTRSSSSTSSFGRSNSLSSPSTSPRITRSPSTDVLRRKKEDLLMLVFDDLVIVAQGGSERSGLFGGKKAREKVWKVLGEGEGIGKVADVKDWTGWQGTGPVFALSLIPLASTPRNPLPGLTTAYSLPVNLSPRSKPLTLAGANLTSLQGFMTVLAQTTASAGIMSEYVVDEKEVLSGEGEWGGYAQ